MKAYLALLLSAVCLCACAKESAPSTHPAAGAPITGKHAAASSGPAASSSSGASVTDLAAVATTQQEGADTGTGSDRGENELERIAALPPEGQLPGGKWVAGTNYSVLSPAQPTSAAPGKVEVIEAFWYGCPHCNALEPYVQSWLMNKAPYIEFVRVPAMWSEIHRAHARLYYTLLELHRSDLDVKVFDEIHQKGDELYMPGDDKATLQLQQKFAKANGISEADFATTYNSFAVQNDLRRADDLMRRYHIDGVPTFIIDGKYESDLSMAGSQSNLMQLVNDLAASEKHHNAE